MPVHEYTPVNEFELITLSEAKQQLRLEADFTDEDTLIGQYILSAQGAAEGYIDRPIGADTLTLTLDAYVASVCFVDWRKVTVASVTILPPDAVERVTLPATAYALSDVYGGDTHTLTFKEVFAVVDVSDSIILTLNCGMWQTVKAACLLYLGALYQFRENIPANTQAAFHNLLRRYRKIS